MVPNDEEVYVVYMILKDGHDYVFDLETQTTVLHSIPYWGPSESYMLLPSQQS